MKGLTFGLTFAAAAVLIVISIPFNSVKAGYMQPQYQQYWCGSYYSYTPCQTYYQPYTYTNTNYQNNTAYYNQSQYSNVSYTSPYYSYMPSYTNPYNSYTQQNMNPQYGYAYNYNSYSYNPYGNNGYYGQQGNYGASQVLCSTVNGAFWSTGQECPGVQQNAVQNYNFFTGTYGGY